jgi:hypothetical protein
LGGGNQEDCGSRLVEAKKSLQDPISANCWAWWCVPVITTMWGSTNRRIVVQVSPGIKQDSISKITKAGWRCGSSGRAPASKITKAARCQWLITIIINTQEAERSGG